MVKQQSSANPRPGHLRGFSDFIREQGIIGMAVGLAIGLAAGDTARKLVEGFVTPLVQFIIGANSNLENVVWHVDLWGRTADFRWGSFASSLISFVATLFVIYLFIHFFKLDRLDKKRG